MMETLGIGCPLRSGVVAALSRALGASLRLRTARGVVVDPHRLPLHPEDVDTSTDIKVKTKHLKGEVRILIPVGLWSSSHQQLISVEGLAFSLVRVSIMYHHDDTVLEVIPSEATQLPSCPAGVDAWSHFSKYAGGLGYGSLEFDFGCFGHVDGLLDMYRFNQKVASYHQIASGDSLDKSLYVIWHWVCASYSMGFGVRLLIPHTLNYEKFIHDNIKRLFYMYLIPRERYRLQGVLLDYLRSDMMVLPPSIDKTSYNCEDPDSDFSAYSSESDDAKDVKFDWAVVERFIGKLKDVINKYQTVVTSVNGVFLDEALWISNKSIESSCCRDAVLQLKSSTAWHHDIGTDAELVIYPGLYFRNAIQFRAYMIEHRLICVEQLFVNDNFDFLASEAETVVRGLKSYVDTMRTQLVDLGEANVILDVTISTKNWDIELVNICALGSLPEVLLSLEDVYHFYYTGVCDGIDSGGKHDSIVIDGILVAFLGSKSNPSKKHSWCPKDVGELKFNTPDDLIDFLRFQTSKG
ncbi:hypothetical protein X943_001199 [Babesia divergens]|uniref:Uncharacterized protein n=1 Tax=Babesia divergens TaxID=32595 RepID=A0AAD9LDZ0_BABDI|nr:hypothetical protein X943_001199 [Babesia divergens]